MVMGKSTYGHNTLLIKNLRNQAVDRQHIDCGVFQEAKCWTSK